MQEGLLAILDICERYDASLGVTLDAAAHARAKGAMLDFLRSRDTLSRDERRDLKRIRAVEVLFQEPCDESTAAVCGFSLERVRMLKRLAAEHAVTSLHERVTPGQEMEHIHFIPCTRKGPLQLAIQAESREILEAAVEKLSPRDQAVLRKRYIEDATMEEIAEDLGLTNDGASKAHAAALGRLRALLDVATKPVFSPQFSRLRLVWKQRQTPAQTAL